MAVRKDDSYLFIRECLLVPPPSLQPTCVVLMVLYVSHPRAQPPHPGTATLHVADTLRVSCLYGVGAVCLRQASLYYLPWNGFRY